MNYVTNFSVSRDTKFWRDIFKKTREITFFYCNKNFVKLHNIFQKKSCYSHCNYHTETMQCCLHCMQFHENFLEYKKKFKQKIREIAKLFPKKSCLLHAVTARITTYVIGTILFVYNFTKFLLIIQKTIILFFCKQKFREIAHFQK